MEAFLGKAALQCTQAIPRFLCPLVRSIILNTTKQVHILHPYLGSGPTSPLPRYSQNSGGPDSSCGKKTDLVFRDSTAYQYTLVHQKHPFMNESRISTWYTNHSQIFAFSFCSGLDPISSNLETRSMKSPRESTHPSLLCLLEASVPLCRERLVRADWFSCTIHLMSASSVPSRIRYR